MGARGYSHDVRALDEAIDAVDPSSPAVGLQRVAERLPLAVSVEMASIRVRAEDEAGDLHLLAAVGVPTADHRRLAFNPAPMTRIRAALALGPRHSQARALGLRWLTGQWLRSDDEVLGTLIVGSRTERRPDALEIEHLGRAARRLAGRLAAMDRRTRALRRASVDLGRLLAERHAGMKGDPRVELRPRERLILELYGDGLSTRQIADVLVLSPHTVQTHVKLARRRLGVGSREEAVRLLNAERVYELL